MDEYDDKKRQKSLEEAFRQLGDQVHLPPEVILAYAEGRLTPDGQESISKHLSACDLCHALLKRAKESCAYGEICKASGNISEAMMVPETVRSKAELLSHINKKKTVIVQELAKLLLPDDLSFAVKPAMSVLQDLEQVKTMAYKQDNNDLAAAAFSSTSEREIQPVVVAIKEAVIFVETLYSSVMSYCCDRNDLTKWLDKCINDALVASHDEIDDAVKTPLFELIARELA